MARTKKSTDSADRSALPVRPARSVYEKLRDGDYVNRLEYPVSGAVIAQRVLRGDQAAKQAKVLDRAERQKAIEAYRAETRRLDAEFKADALAEVGLTGHPKADAAYSLAWEYGHAAGLSEVMNYLPELADLAR
jgi:hypothetical protein